MINLPENINSLSLKHGFTMSAMYDPAWMFENAMGPNPLWLMEWLSRDMQLSNNTLVLDMGCGKAMTSIFLAKEFGCTVFANDLWIPADDNRERIEALALGQKVFPIHAEAHDLPYAPNSLDAIPCIDAYQFFGPTIYT
jgi:cyclopropane fatty-acyl-phospholipid synthase-like methyltransferase